MSTKIIGVDPAPGKNSTMFSLEMGFENLSLRELASRINELKKDSESVLLCWDAPLTGPGEIDGNIINDAKFTQRPIEKYLSKAFKIAGKKMEGVSIQPFSNCPHWTITRHVLGLPKVGPYDIAEIPFKLITDPLVSGEYKKSIIEVHPTLAVRLWLNADFKPYKGRTAYGKKLTEGDKELNAKENFEKLKGILELLMITEIDIENKLGPKEKIGDRLDAITAWVLGYLWIYDNDKVVKIGNLVYGQILLPKVNETNIQLDPDHSSWLV